MADRYDGYGIEVFELTGNLMPGDTTGLDVEESPRRYCELLRERLAARFPGAKIAVHLENAEGVCHGTTVYMPDGDIDHNAILTIGDIEEALWGSDEWYVDSAN